MPRSRRRGVDRIGATTTVFDAALGSRRMHDETLWWADDGRRAVVVGRTSRWSSQRSTAWRRRRRAAARRSELRQIGAGLDAAVARGLQDVQLVERWEARGRRMSRRFFLSYVRQGAAGGVMDVDPLRGPIRSRRASSRS